MVCRYIYVQMKHIVWAKQYKGKNILRNITVLRYWFTPPVAAGNEINVPK